MDLNFTTPLNFLGYGVCGRNILRELSKLSRVACWPIGNIEYNLDEQEYINKAIQQQSHYSNYAPSIRLWHQFDLAQHVGNGKKIGFPIFELDRFNERELHHLNRQDLLFVPSAWAKQVCIENGIDESIIHVIPFGVDTSIFFPRNSKKHETIFLNVGKWELRKGHDLIRTIFEKAFTKDDPVELWMVCDNPCFPSLEEYKTYNQQWTKYYNQSPLADKIKLIPRLRTQNELALLMGEADCGIFPSRAEGWNLDLSEMMAMGKEVITTNYSAHTEFCNEKNAMLVDIQETQSAYDGVWFKGQGNWAKIINKHIDQFVDFMRAVHKDKQGGHLRNRGNLIPEFTWNKTGERIVGLLNA